MSDSRLSALRTSHDRLTTIAAKIPDVTAPAYPSEWTIAATLSHLGSGAEIFTKRLVDTLAGTELADDFAQAIWAVWDAKDPESQRADALAADRALVDALEATPAEDRERFTFSFGPISGDFDAYVGMRLNEHVLHTWDVEVTLDPSATLPDELAAEVIVNMGLLLRFGAQPTGDTTTVSVGTPDGAHGLTVDLTPDAATATAGPIEGSPDVMLPTEAIVRLAYGRLDPEHTPAGAEGPALDTLRKVFPGF